MDMYAVQASGAENILILHTKPNPSLACVGILNEKKIKINFMLNFYFRWSISFKFSLLRETTRKKRFGKFVPTKRVRMFPPANSSLNLNPSACKILASVIIIFNKGIFVT